MAEPPLASHLQSDGALAGLDLFDCLDPDLRSRLLTVVQPRRYRRGALVYREGQAGDELLLLMSGVVALFRGSKAGRRAMLAAIHPPSVFGEEALAEGMPRMASAEAVQEAFVLVLPEPKLRELMRRHPVLGETARRWLASQLVRFAEHLADDILLDLPGRVAKTLLGLATDGHRPAEIRLSQSMLASLARGSRQSVNKTLKRFERRGWLYIGGGNIVITDVDALARWRHHPAVLSDA